jgi:hypothetical protein
MSDFVDKLRLKESAEEDLYFAREDRKLIESLHREKLAKAGTRGQEEEGRADEQAAGEPRYGGREGDRGVIRWSAGSWRALLDRANRLFRGRRRR